MAVHVMVIDPSVTIRKVLEISLQRVGYTVVGFADPLVALRFLRACPDCIPRVFMIAAHLPGISFSRVVKHILRCAPFQLLIIIALLDQRDSLIARLYARMAGAVRCITKPFRTRDIVDMLSQHFPIERESLYWPVVPLSEKLRCCMF